MLCSACHVHVRRDFPYCLSCGTVVRGAKLHTFDAPELRWGRDSVASIVALETSIGRVDGNDVVIDDESVSRAHARIVRTPDEFRIEDLGSFNGTSVLLADGTERELAEGESAVLHDGTVVFVGDVRAVFGQPRTTMIGSKTRVRDASNTMLKPQARADGGGATAPAATEPLSARPVRRSGWALKKVSDGHGGAQWMLRNTSTGTYLSLDEREVFVWEQLDGVATIRDVLFAYLERFGELALPRIESAVRTFADAGLVQGLPDSEPEPTPWQRFGRFLLQNLLRIELSITGIDPLVERAYRAWAWRLFSPVAVALLWVLVLGGLYSFWYAAGEQQLFNLAGAGALGGAVVLVGYLVSTALHEAAHAFAVKSYGRRVNRGGFQVMLGMPFAFVDTSDMWFGTPYSRIVVAVSGPLTTTAIAGAASATAVWVPSPQVAGVCFTLAFGLYVNTLFNMIPLMPLDGYQAFADALRTPRLREEAKQYLFQGLWRDIAARRRPGVKEIGLLGFAVFSLLCLYAMLGLIVVLWDSRLGALLRDHVDQPWLTVLVVLGIALVIFPVWFLPARTLVTRLRSRRRGDVGGTLATTSPSATSQAAAGTAASAPAEPGPA